MAEKKLPLRMCVVSRKMLPKQDLIRLVVTDEGVVIDRSQKMDGRGYWISKNKDVIALARKRHAFSKVLKKNIDDSIYQKLEAYVDGK